MVLFGMYFLLQLIACNWAPFMDIILYSATTIKRLLHNQTPDQDLRNASRTPFPQASANSRAWASVKTLDLQVTPHSNAIEKRFDHAIILVGVRSVSMSIKLFWHLTSTSGMTDSGKSNDPPKLFGPMFRVATGSTFMEIPTVSCS